MADSTEHLTVLLELKQQEFEKNAKNASNAIDRLERKLDPLAAAEAKLEKQQKRFNAALKAGTIDTKAHAKGMDLLQREYDQSSARIARMNGAVGSNTGIIAKNRFAFQQAGYQVQDFFVQVQGGTSAVTAFTQQGSQMLGVFGAYGAIAGAALAIGAPLAAHFLSSGEGAVEFKDAIKDLREAVAAYATAVDNADISTEELAAKYGVASEAARTFLTELQNISGVEAIQQLDSAVLNLSSTFGAFDFASMDGSEYENTLRKLRSELELTGIASVEVARGLEALGNANAPREQADAAGNLLRIMTDALGPFDDMNAAAQELYKKIVDVGDQAAILTGEIDNSKDSMLEVVQAVYAAAGGMDGLVSKADSLAVSISGAALRAWDLVGAMGAARLEYERTVGAGRGGDPRKFGGSAKNIQTHSARSQLAYQPGGSAGVPLPKVKKSGGSKRSKSGSATAKTSIFANTESELSSLERQIEMIGKSKSEIAGLTAKHKLLDEAKKRGLDLDTKQATTGKTLGETIDAQAGAMARLTEEYERAEKSQSEFEAGVDNISDSMADVLTGSKTWKEAMADIFTELARDIAKSGIKSAISGLKPSQSGGGSLIGSLFGGGASSLFAGFFDKGGNIPSGQFGIAGENGAEIIRGPASVTSTKDTAAMFAGGGSSTVTIQLGEGLVGGILQQAGNQTVQIVSAATQGQQQALPGSIQAISARGTT